MASDMSDSARRKGPVLLLAVAVAVLLALAGCAGGAGGPSAPLATTGPETTSADAPRATPSTTTTAVPSSAPGGSIGQQAASTIVIKDFEYAPANITVSPGATVTVVDQDTSNHTVTAQDRAFDTGNIPGTATGTFVAPTASGSYPYLCSIHPFMTGTLTVR